MIDAKPLNDMADILRGIAKTLEDFSRAAAKAGESGGHEDPLLRINGSLADISEVVKGLNHPGNHSAEYERIERSLRDMASAVKDIAASTGK